MRTITPLDSMFFYTERVKEYAPSLTGDAKRIAVAFAPFLSLNSSLKFPVSVIMRASSVWNVDRKEYLKVAVAVIALVSTILHSQVGSVVTTVQNTIKEVENVRKAKTREEAIRSLFKILNNLVHLALIAQGGAQLTAIAYAMQAVVSLIQSGEEFNGEHWIEGVANLLMAIVRVDQSIRVQV